MRKIDITMLSTIHSAYNWRCWISWRSDSKLIHDALSLGESTFSVDDLCYWGCYWIRSFIGWIKTILKQELLFKDLPNWKENNSRKSLCKYLTFAIIHQTMLFQIGGWSFEPVPDNPNATKATLMSEIDLKGSIPQSVIKMAHKQ